jgi:tetratricopeptide (TPR) repeat protein
LKLAPASQTVEVEAALAFAMAGDTARAESLAQDFGKRFPLDTLMQSLWLPTIQAQLTLDRKNPALALGALQAAYPIELSIKDSCLYHVYVRGQAYLAAGQGTQAAAEFQKILDHSGIVWNCWTGALARLGVARANALQAKTSQGADAARVRALAAYTRVERRRPGHPRPQTSQNRVRETAMSGFRVFSLTRRTNAGWLPTAQHGVYMFFVHLLDHGNAMTEDRHSVAGLNLPFLLAAAHTIPSPAHQEVSSGVESPFLVGGCSRRL